MTLDTILALFVAAFSSLFTIVNPVSCVSVFLGITRRDSHQKRRRMAKKACVVAAIMLMIFSIAGNYILSFFSITLNAFMIAGGLMVAGIGLGMLHHPKVFFRSTEEHKEATQKEDVSIIPLAIPMLAGPGAMTAAIVLMSTTQSVIDSITILAAIITVCLVSYIILSRADVIDKVLGKTSRTVIDKIMGLIVLVVGVQFIVNGIEGLLHLWMFI